MAWTTPTTWSVGGVPTGSDFNVYIRDNMDYLKTETDKLGDLSSASSGNTVDTEYTNSTKIRAVTICISASTGANYGAAKIGSTSPPSDTVGVLGFAAHTGTSASLFYNSITIIVPPNFYYTLSTQAGVVTKEHWYEANFF